MREIKFRAWDDAEKAFDYSDALGLEAFFAYFPDGGDQYTGLKDKNGVEIYEGDIVKGTVGGSTDGEIYPQEQTIKCEFEREGYWSIICFNDDGEMEVIGNIYENPEMLEAKS